MSYFGPRRPKRSRGDPKKSRRSATHKTPDVGVLARHGQVVVSEVPNRGAAILRDHTLRWVKRGTLVYTDKRDGYDTLAFCGYRHLRLDHARHFARGKVHINGLESFWSYAKTKFIRHQGVNERSSRSISTNDSSATTTALRICSNYSSRRA